MGYEIAGKRHPMKPLAIEIFRGNPRARNRVPTRLEWIPVKDAALPDGLSALRPRHRQSVDGGRNGEGVVIPTLVTEGRLHFLVPGGEVGLRPREGSHSPEHGRKPHGFRRACESTGVVCLIQDRANLETPHVLDGLGSPTRPFDFDYYWVGYGGNDGDDGNDRDRFNHREP